MLFDASHQHLGSNKSMAIAFLNITDLCNHPDEVQLLIRDLGIQIFALNETKLYPDNSKELTMVASYHQERLDSKCNCSLFLKQRGERVNPLGRHQL